MGLVQKGGTYIWITNSLAYRFARSAMFRDYKIWIIKAIFCKIRNVCVYIYKCVIFAYAKKNCHLGIFPVISPQVSIFYLRTILQHLQTIPVTWRNLILHVFKNFFEYLIKETWIMVPLLINKFGPFLNVPAISFIKIKGLLSSP